MQAREVKLEPGWLKRQVEAASRRAAEMPQWLSHMGLDERKDAALALGETAMHEQWIAERKVKDGNG